MNLSLPTLQRALSLWSVVALLVLLGTPSLGHAHSFWPHAAGCAIGDPAAEERPSEREDCSALDPADPSFNTCFEDAGAPVSSIPSLVAEAQADEQSRSVVERALHVLRVPVAEDEPSASIEGEEAVESSTFLASGRWFEVGPVPLTPEEPMCSVHPVRCSSAPSLPHVLSFEALSHGAPLPSAVELPRPPPALRISEPRAWGEGIAALERACEPLVPPPRMA